MSYSGPVQLTPIPWGKRDQELGFAVCQHMVDATPPLVLLWSPRSVKVRQLLKSEHIHDARIEDLDRLTDHRSVYRVPTNTVRPLLRRVRP